MSGKPKAVGPIGRVVADAVERLRIDNQLTFDALSDLAGRRISSVDIRRIRDYERHVDVDDLVCLASALKTTPSALMDVAAQYRRNCLKWLLAEDDSRATEHVGDRHSQGL